MLRKINSLIAAIASITQMCDEEAQLQLALILELSSQGFPSNSMVASGLLFSEYSEIRLSKEEQIEIVNFLIDLMTKTSGSKRAQLIWILSKTSPEIALAPFLSKINSLGFIFDTEELFQTLLTLDAFLFESEDKALLAFRSALLIENNISHLLPLFHTPALLARDPNVPEYIDKIKRSFEKRCSF